MREGPGGVRGAIISRYKRTMYRREEEKEGEVEKGEVLKGGGRGGRRRWRCRAQKHGRESLSDLGGG